MAQFFKKRLNKKDAVVFFAESLKTWCQSIAVMEAAIDLVSNNPDAMLSCELEDRTQFI